MQIEILPGFSPKNEEWALTVQKEIEELGPVSVIRWHHWDSKVNVPGWIKDEASKIAQRIGRHKITIIAKSVGTLVAMEVLRANPKGIDKLVLCGIPIEDFEEEDNTRFVVLTDFDAERIVIIQNEDDPHGKPEQVIQLLQKANLGSKVQSKPRDDHEYPYAADFKTFISGDNS